MEQNMLKHKVRVRNHILSLISKNDPCRFKDRTVKPEKGKGRKDRPRNKKFDSYELVA